MRGTSTYYRTAEGLLIDEIGYFETAYLKRQAEKYRLALPPRKVGDWVSEGEQGEVLAYLSPVGVASMYRQIREEKKRRRETAEWWVKMFSMGVPAVLAVIYAVSRCNFPATP